MSHTPGLWNILEIPTSSPMAAKQIIITGKNGVYDIAVVRNIGNEDNGANARLIAAAPDLLDALKEATRCLAWHAKHHPAGMDCKVVEDARAAIAKAEGE